MPRRSVSTLAVCPVFLTQPVDLAVTTGMIRSLRATEPALELLVVDDCSPAAGLLDELAGLCGELRFEVARSPSNEGFSRTVNVGLARARAEGRNAVLVNADIEFIEPGWLGCMEAQPTSSGDGPASIVGGLLLYPNGLIQHAGILFSLLHRGFTHWYQYAPGDLPEAQLARAVPVTGALQFIRHECLAEIGVYDPDFRMGFEDVDYCLRARVSGRECVYQPAVKAFHVESMFRGRRSVKVAAWQRESWLLLMRKWSTHSFADLVPPIA